jgi:hypothetical protein
VRMARSSTIGWLRFICCSGRRAAARHGLNHGAELRVFGMDDRSRWRQYWVERGQSECMMYAYDRHTHHITLPPAERRYRAVV